MCRISVVIPSYNAEQYIRETLQSVLSQTVSAIEIIVVDDGSADRTCEIIREHTDRVQLIRQQNAGPAAARNRAVQQASGDWIAFLDADDLWTPEKLERQLQVAEQTGSELIYTDRENFGACEHVSRLQSDGVHLYEGDIFEPLLLGNFITLSSVLISRSLFARLGGFNESQHFKAVEDWDLWIRAASAERIALCSDPLTKYRWHAGGISRDPQQMQANLFYVLEQAFELPRGQQLSNAFKKRALAAAWSVVGWEAASKQPRSGLPYFAKSLQYAPVQPQIWKQLLKACLGRT